MKQPSTAIKTFFYKIGALFSNFQKRAGETSPSLPPLVTNLSAKVFSCEFCKSLRATSLENTSEWLPVKNFVFNHF